MKDKDMQRLLKSNPRLIQYCLDRILEDDETAKILRSINDRAMRKYKQGRNSGKDKSDL